VSVLATTVAGGCYGGRLLAERIDESALADRAVNVGDAGMTDAGPSTSEELQQRLVARWNAVPLAGQRIQVYGATIDFVWPTFGEFPHPTFKGGSEGAYQAFARVLLAFMQAGDNFQFLAESQLFDIVLGYASESRIVEAGWTFRELVELCASGVYAVEAHIDAETRSGLAEVEKRIPEP
jgi:hypothetical protein